MGDYGVMDSGQFRCRGNIFADFGSIASEEDIISGQHKVSLFFPFDPRDVLDPLCLSLPSNPGVNSLLASLSSRLSNTYLVTRTVQLSRNCESTSISTCTFIHDLIVGLDGMSNSESDITKMTLCTIAMPLVWYRDEDSGSASVDQTVNCSAVITYGTAQVP